MSGQWVVELWQPLGGVITNLPDAQDLQLSLSLVDGDTFSFTISGFDPKAQLINEMFTDVVVYRNGDKLYRGRIVNAIQNGDSDGATVSVSSVDYKTLLKRKFIISGVIYSGDVEFLGWNAINVAQLRGDLGIQRGVNQGTGVVVPSFPVEAGTSVYDLINKLTQTNTAVNASDCFEWLIDADLTYKVYQPTRGKRTPTFLADFGGSVLSYDTSFDPNSYANVFYVQGNGSYSTTVKTDEGRRSPAGGILEEWINDGNLTTPELVDSKAFWLATFNGQLELCKTYNLELSNSRWNGPRDCWLGDFILLDIQHGIVNVKTDQMRVMDMHITVDSSGYEGVAIGVSYAVPSSWRDYNRMSTFMRATRSDVLRTRATWYKNQLSAISREYQNAVKRHGKNSYEAKASLARFKSLQSQQKAWENKLDFSRPGRTSRF